MLEKFKLWSNLEPKAKQELHPDLGLRNWDELSREEREKIWHHMEYYFSKADRKYYTILFLNEGHKYQSYGKYFLTDSSTANASIDFKNIFLNCENGQHIVFELISYYSKAVLMEQAESIYRSSKETEIEFNERLTEWKYQKFDAFANRLNDVFEHFGINVVLTRCGLIPKQEQKIIQEVYKPVLKFLSNEKWKPVNRELRDAFDSFQQKNDTGYSSCVTHSVTAIEAFLQILINGKTGKNTLGNLLVEAQKQGSIPNDKFSNQIFKNLESIFAQERKETGDAHPKNEYANEKNALMILNLTMVFLQHCILCQK
ncbi:MAG: hypothetical protein COU29_00390 [Candidatus Magasanikbacteria bacterium CG10_big_fil_rev_8_21_14_0_10_36_32]|uniref:Abortive infection protein-like C-terminal domain-containing protein n=1 Tax=Candidatus Magasanikbacteria bacterium CG10_big_fil_rev_8_21_14_0_10_36_32 TaxID=1974646 RepID=A0A2M6W7Q5_9BACT|nr:MAG: hypothetical protein COU29_00390 [Candidatus Magasanikbacteria bacterium CG10_big_fil_rev_8_21_14_0_10_36_32]